MCYANERLCFKTSQFLVFADDKKPDSQMAPKRLEYIETARQTHGHILTYIHTYIRAHIHVDR